MKKIKNLPKVTIDVVHKGIKFSADVTKLELQNLIDTPEINFDDIRTHRLTLVVSEFDLFIEIVKIYLRKGIILN